METGQNNIYASAIVDEETAAGHVTDHVTCRRRSYQAQKCHYQISRDAHHQHGQTTTRLLFYVIPGILEILPTSKVHVSFQASASTVTPDDFVVC